MGVLNVNVMTIKNSWAVLFATALTLPLLVFYHYPPNGSVFADGLSLILWAGVAAVLVITGFKTPERVAKGHLTLNIRQTFGHLVSPHSVNLILGITIFYWAIQVRQGQYGFLSVVLTTCAAAFVAWAAFAMGMRWASHKTTDDNCTSFALALVGMGLVVSSLGWVQYFHSDGIWPWINSLETAGRIYGNLRQPNHLALVLAWSIWGIIWYSTRLGKLWRPGILALLFIVPVLVMTGSRMGQALMVGFVALSWLSPHRQLRLKFTLLAFAIYVVTWLVVGAIAQNGGPSFFGLRGTMLTSTGSRYELWSQVIHVLGQTPWYGCGIGQFNFCWTHAVLDDRVFGAVFHAHNLFLNGVIEWGWPLTVLLMLWLGVGAVMFIRYGATTAAALPAGIFLSSLVHTMLEYPWWYPYLLLPTAFSLGWMWSLSYGKYLCAKDTELNLHHAVKSQPFKLRGKLQAFFPGVLLLCFGIIYVQQYLPLRFLFAAGYAKSIKAEDLSRINAQAALYSMPLSYAIVMKLTENIAVEDAAAMIPYLKLAGRGTTDPAFLSRFALVAAMAQENAMAQHLAWRAIQSDPEQREKLVRRVEQVNSKSLSVFAAYLQNPKAVSLDRSVFAK